VHKRENEYYPNPAAYHTYMLSYVVVIFLEFQTDEYALVNSGRFKLQV